jgi:hypothetical protein
MTWDDVRALLADRYWVDWDLDGWMGIVERYELAAGITEVTIRAEPVNDLDAPSLLLAAQIGRFSLRSTHRLDTLNPIDLERAVGFLAAEAAWLASQRAE